MDYTHNEETVKRLAVLWWMILGCLLALVLYLWGSSVYQHQAQEYAQRGWLAHLAHYGDPSGTALFFWLAGIAGIAFLRAPSRFLAGCHAAWLGAYQTRRQQVEVKRNIEEQTGKNQAARQQSRLTQSQQEVISRLGAMDGFLRVLEVEVDPAKRTVALQAAHSEIVALEAKGVSGVIPQDVLSHPMIQDHAKATSEHLARIGLADDRLNQELVRLFRLA